MFNEKSYVFNLGNTPVTISTGKIARQAGALYDKFEGFVSDLMKIGNKIKDSKSEYDNAMNKLVDGRGNLITSVEKLKKMGAKAKKSLPDNILSRANSEEEI